MQEDSINIDNHLTNINLQQLTAIVVAGDFALQNKNFQGALNAYWKVFKKTCGFEMIEKIMLIYKGGDASAKAMVRNRLLAAVTYICSKVQDKSVKYGLLFDFGKLMLDNNLITIADRIDKIQRKLIRKNNTKTEESPTEMISSYWEQAGTLIPNSGQTAISASYGSKN